MVKLILAAMFLMICLISIQKAKAKAKKSCMTELSRPGTIDSRRTLWTCKCGKKMYDVYTKLPSSAIRYAHIGTRESVTFSGSGGPPGNDRWRDVQDNADVTMPSLPGSVDLEAGLSRHAQGEKSNAVDRNTDINMLSDLSSCQFLLLCVPFKRHANKLLNIDTSMPPQTDVMFFKLLRRTYNDHRGHFRNFLSLRAMSEIRFVQFEVFRNDLADVRKFDCIPPEAQRDNYLYRPMPATFEPPIGKNQMRHLYDHPDHADDLPICFSRVPRKLRERLSVTPATGTNDGWGICFIESLSWPRVCMLGLLGILASTIFGMAWTVAKDDIQGGFGVASYMLGVIVLGLGALQGAFEM
jgi:hypothetical protein